MDSNNQSQLRLKNFDSYLNIADNSSLHYVDGCATNKHIGHTFDLYFNNICDDSIFESSEINSLKSWIKDISNYHRSSDKEFPRSSNIKTEAIIFNGQIILKESFNLLHLITRYHCAYKLKTENEESLKDTIYHISQDRVEIRKKLNSFDKKSKSYRKSKKERAPFILMKKVLKLLLSEKYKYRADYYIYTIALNHDIINWKKFFEDANDDEAMNILFDVINYFMYKNISENKIKNSLMILVYTFLSKRLHLKEKDALDFTNYLAHNILYDMDNKNDYRKTELSHNIYINSVFNALPIFYYNNPKYKSLYSIEQEDKIIHSIKKYTNQINDSYKFIDNDRFIDSFKNSHIDYIKHDLLFLYNSKEE